jgi:hypothetical protein
MVPLRACARQDRWSAALLANRSDPRGSNPSCDQLRPCRGRCDEWVQGRERQALHLSLFLCHLVTEIAVPHGLTPVTLPQTVTPVPGGMNGLASNSA